MPIYDYQCLSCGKYTEKLLRISERETPGLCGCGGVLQFVISTPHVHLDGADLSFPGAAMKWEKDRARIMEKEKKNMKENGDYYNNNRHW